VCVCGVAWRERARARARERERGRGRVKRVSKMVRATRDLKMGEPKMGEP
jgi:hypothetical protein